MQNSGKCSLDNEQVSVSTGASLQAQITWMDHETCEINGLRRQTFHSPQTWELRRSKAEEQVSVVGGKCQHLKRLSKGQAELVIQETAVPVTGEQEAEQTDQKGAGRQ